LLLANIGQLLTLRGDSAPRRGSALDDIGLLKDAALLCGGGKIIAVGPQRELLRNSWFKKNRSKIHEYDCQGKVVVPGLAEKVSAALRAMLRHGTSVVEAKSGYGLSVEAEIKSLEAIREAAKFWPGTVKPTLLAAHVVPQEYAGRQGEYVRLVCEEIIPLVARRKLAEYVDVFCERGAFTLQQSAQIMAAARRHGLDTRAHVCQFTPSQLSGLLEHNPASLDHMDCIAEPDFKALAGSETVAVLLPGANYFLGHKEFPNARRLIEEGVAMALATDYNPGTSPTVSMPFVISLACTHMKMTPAEAIAASTMNAACALRLQSRKGSIEPGKDADLAVFDVPDYREIAYWFAWNRCAEMVVGGELQDFAAN
jgi:imidazolonepropionase